jgi:hypothetical protein
MTDDWIGIILPTKDGKYVMAKATIVEEDINTLKDAAIMVSDVEGVKSDLKYPFVLLKDIEILKQKLIEDLINYDGFLSQKGDEDSTLECPKSEIIDLINKRFGVNE